MKTKTLAASAVALVLMLPGLTSADPWKDESGHGRGRHGHDDRKHDKDHHKHKHKHKKDDDRGPDVVYIYDERPREKEVIYVERPAREKEVIYVYDERPREKEVVYVEEERPRQREVVHVNEERPRQVASTSGNVGIERGTCNRDAVGAVLGGVVGGVLGAQVGRHNGNEGAGMVVGAIAGVLLGNKIGSGMDEQDQACTAQTLEHAQNGQTVSWRNPENGLDYKMTPVDSFQKNNMECRRYVAVVGSGGSREEIEREACKHPDGQWQVNDKGRS